MTNAGEATPTTGAGAAATTEAPLAVERRPRTAVVIVFCLLFLAVGVGLIRLGNEANSASDRAAAAERRMRAAEQEAVTSRQEIARLSGELAEERRRRVALEGKVGTLADQPEIEDAADRRRRGGSPPVTVRPMPTETPDQPVTASPTPSPASDPLTEAVNSLRPQPSAVPPTP